MSYSGDYPFLEEFMVVIGKSPGIIYSERLIANYHELYRIGEPLDKIKMSVLKYLPEIVNAIEAPIIAKDLNMYFSCLERTVRENLQDSVRNFYNNP
jgi:hypothetical protein